MRRTNESRLLETAAASLAMAIIAGGCAATSNVLRGRIVLLDLETSSVEHRVRGDFTSAGEIVMNPGGDYDDERMAIRFAYRSTHLELSVANSGAKPLQVRWNEAAFIDPDGTPHQVFTGDLERYQSNESPPPGALEVGASMATPMSPTDYVFWYGPINRYGEGAWDQRPLLPDRTDGTPEELARRLDELPGLVIGVFLPVEIDGVIHDYRFMFRPVNVRPGPVLEGRERERFFGDFGPEH